MSKYPCLDRCFDLEASSTLEQLYGDNYRDALPRFETLLDLFGAQFGGEPEFLFSAPGRTEIGGNHTDHENGIVLAGSVNLDVIAAVRPNSSGVIRIQSQGFPIDEIDLHALEPIEAEKNTSAAIIRGIAARFHQLGYQIGGLDAYTTSGVLKGSGLSSSAAFEVLVGTILSHVFNGGSVGAVEIAKIGKYAENEFFGKPSGLLDQMASSVGGAVYMDFANPAEPKIDPLHFDFAASGHALCIIDSGADHADLTHEYAAVPEELRRVCAVFGKTVLREVPKADFLARLPEVRKAAGDRGALRAFHIYADNDRVVAERAALLSGDFDRFLTLVRESGRSSFMYLQNVVPTGATAHQEVAFALALCDELLGERGAFRVHGGGFAGTVQAFVPEDMLHDFKEKVEAVLGAGSCYVLRIRPLGGAMIARL